MEKLNKLFDEATARPWKIVVHKNFTHDNSEIFIEDHTPDGIKSSVARVSLRNATGANARLITLAANHFEAVVEALEKAANRFDDTCSIHPSQAGMWATAAKDARSVLTAIEKELS